MCEKSSLNCFLNLWNLKKKIDALKHLVEKFWIWLQMKTIVLKMEHQFIY